MPERVTLYAINQVCTFIDDDKERLAVERRLQDTVYAQTETLETDLLLSTEELRAKVRQSGIDPEVVLRSTRAQLNRHSKRKTHLVAS
jgi:hypothetical protein